MVDLRKRQSAVDPYVPLVWSSSLNIYILFSIVISHLNNYTNSLSASLADVLLTAFPESLREVAATNIPDVSKLLWLEFLDGPKPAWFTDLPTDIESYLVQQYGPLTASALVCPLSPIYILCN